MASEIDQAVQRLGNPVMETIATETRYRVRLQAAWLSGGGVATNGIKYASPDHATAWGKQGCPLLPREVRQQLSGTRLSGGIEQLLDAPLTIDQLDSGVLERLSLGKLPEATSRAFRDFLYNLPLHDHQVAIPAGIPLAWFETLPLTGRTRAAVQKAFRDSQTDTFLSDPARVRDFLRIRNVGLVALNELRCVVESAELEWTGDAQGGEPVVSLMRDSAYEELINAATLEFVKSMSSFSEHLYSFARWSMAETGARTFVDAIEEQARTLSGNEIWKAVASLRLSDLAARPPHPYQVVDDWARTLGTRSRIIMLTRISTFAANKCTLQELADQFNVTRERIRQVEARVRRQLQKFLKTDAAVPIRWRSETLRQQLGVAAPTNSVEHLLTAPPGCHDHRHILLEMAGPYEDSDGWFTLCSAQTDDPTPTVLSHADENGRFDIELAHSLLTTWGVKESYHEAWLMRDKSIRQFNGQLVRWGGSIPDRMVFALSDLRRPATVDEMMSHVGETRARVSVGNALVSDHRLVRVNRSHWGLASWGLPEYSGVAESMRSILEELGGPLSIAEMARLLKKSFGVVESTTLAYCSAPMFLVEGESLRLRGLGDEPFQCDADQIWRTPGVFRLGPKRLGRLLKVDTDLIRGSGSSLTHAAGAILYVKVNDHLSFSNRSGDRVDITFPETSIVGPSIGSVRRIAEALAAKEGDNLTLILDRSDMSISTHLTDQKDTSPSWEIVGRLTGLPSPVNLSTLAGTLGCETGEVRSFLRARGDDVVLDCLPQQESSPSLDEALFELASQIENVQGGST